MLPPLIAVEAELVIFRIFEEVVFNTPLVSVNVFETFTAAFKVTPALVPEVLLILRYAKLFALVPPNVSAEEPFKVTVRLL